MQTLKSKHKTLWGGAILMVLDIIIKPDGGVDVDLRHRVPEVLDLQVLAAVADVACPALQLLVSLEDDLQGIFAAGKDDPGQLGVHHLLLDLC